MSGFIYSLYLLDISIELADILRKPFTSVPPRANLKEVLLLPLERKIPLLPPKYDKLKDKLELTEVQMSLLFTRSEKGSADLIWDKCLSRIIYPQAVGQTEQSFISCWNDSIRATLKFFLPEIDCDRNTSCNSSTLTNRPDLVALYNSKCLFRGEEKGPNDSDDPRQELVDKLNGWDYEGEMLFLVVCCCNILVVL